MIRFKPARTSLGAFEIRNALVNSSATINVGDPIRRNSSNTDEIEEHPAGGTTTGFLGIAGAPAVSGTPDFGSDLLYYVLNQQTEFVGQVYDVSASAVITISTTPGTYEGNSYGLIQISGNWYVDEEDTSQVVIRVTEEMPEINAVLFKFLTAAIVD